VKHCRMVQWLAGTGWVVVDDLEGAGRHDLRLHWLVGDWPYEVSSSPFHVVFTAAQSPVRWSMVSSSPGRGMIVRAGVPVHGSLTAEDAQLLGWESPTYGDLQPAVSLVYETRSRLPVRFVTVVLTDARCKLESRDGHLVVLKSDSGGEFEAYRVDLSTKEMQDTATSRGR